MGHTIMVPIDRSRFGEQAIPAAVAVARQTGATVHLVRVYEPLGVMPAFDVMPLYDPEWEDKVRRGEESDLKTVAEVVRERAGVSVQHALIDGPVVDALLRYAADVGADLVVMSTHGRSGIGRLVLGSVAEAVVRRAPCPVMLVRPRDGVENDLAHLLNLDQIPVFKHILVPVDGTEFAKKVISRAVAIGAPFDARYTLLRVVSPALPPGWPYATTEFPRDGVAERIRARRQLDAIAEGLRSQALRASTEVLTDTEPAKAILDYADWYGVDLIAMTTHGRRGLSRLALGSVAEAVARESRVPVLLFRPGPEEEEEEEARERPAAQVLVANGSVKENVLPAPTRLST
jgi:nucleotide-binding universal stress UspA family protein